MKSGLKRTQRQVSLLGLRPVKPFAVIKGKRFNLQDGDAIIIPPGARHNITSTGDEPLKLYTIYTPPEHERNFSQRYS